MESILSLVKLLLRHRLITKVEYEGVAVVIDAVTLETTTLLIVGNTELVKVPPPEPHCLLVYG